MTGNKRMQQTKEEMEEAVEELEIVPIFDK